MKMTTRKLLLGTALLIAGAGVASAQGMHQGAGAGAHGGAAAGISGGGAQAGGGASQNAHGHAGAQLGGHAASRGTVGAGGQADAHANRQGAARSERARAHGNVQGNAHGNLNAREHTRGAGQASREENAQHNAQQRNAQHNERRRNEHAHANANANAHGTVGQASREENAQRNTRRNEHQRSAQRNEQQRNEQMRRQAQTPSRSTNGQATNEQNGRTNAQNQAAGSRQNQVGANAQNGGNRVQLTSQQRTHIRDRVLSRRNIPRLNHVDFALRAGVVVPQRVHYVAISQYPTLVDVFPEYRDDYFVVAEDDIVILSPQRRVVDVVPLNGSASAHVASSGSVELSSTEIREVQQVLIDRGYDIEVDGVWGPATRHALITFQEREGLPATGVITTQTVASLGLRGRIAASHIESGASTTGQGDARENGNMNGPGDQPNMQQGQQRSNNRNANAPQDRSTTGQANGQQPQQPSTNGQGGSQSRPSTNGQGGSQSGANNAGAHSNAPSQGQMQQSKSPQK